MPELIAAISVIVFIFFVAMCASAVASEINARSVSVGFVGTVRGCGGEAPMLGATAASSTGTAVTPETLCAGGVGGV